MRAVDKGEYYFKSTLVDIDFVGQKPPLRYLEPKKEGYKKGTFINYDDTVANYQMIFRPKFHQMLDISSVVRRKLRLEGRLANA